MKRKGGSGPAPDAQDESKLLTNRPLYNIQLNTTKKQVQSLLSMKLGRVYALVVIFSSMQKTVCRSNKCLFVFFNVSMVKSFQVRR